MFQFHRLLQYARPRLGSQQPFFWMFVDNLLLTQDDQATATRFFEVRVGLEGLFWPTSPSEISGSWGGAQLAPRL
jgi:hypothetical protein